jgi:hypothetical protein
MSVLQFISSGGMANIGGDLPNEEKDKVNGLLKVFHEKLIHVGRSLQVPASAIKLREATYLFVGKDTSNYHIVFSNDPGGNTLNYRDLSSHGNLSLQSLVHQVRIEIGDVYWAFSLPIKMPDKEAENFITQIAHQYINSVLQSDKKPDKKISEEALKSPEIASGIEKFRKDYPSSQKTAFIIMQFGSTPAHSTLVECVKSTLEKYDIIGLRADDKEYMDDLYPNVKVYMHACDFGIAVFDRLTADDFNPNVSLEVGYLFGMGKNVLLLKDQTLKSLHTDLTGKLYKEFDPQNIEDTLPQQVEKWLSDKGII